MAPSEIVVLLIPGGGGICRPSTCKTANKHSASSKHKATGKSLHALRVSKTLLTMWFTPNFNTENCVQLQQASLPGPKSVAPTRILGLRLFPRLETKVEPATKSRGVGSIRLSCLGEEAAELEPDSAPIAYWYPGNDSWDRQPESDFLLVWTHVSSGLVLQDQRNG